MHETELLATIAGGLQAHTTVTVTDVDTAGTAVGAPADDLREAQKLYQAGEAVDLLKQVGEAGHSVDVAEQRRSFRPLNDRLCISNWVGELESPMQGVPGFGPLALLS